MKSCGAKTNKCHFHLFTAYLLLLFERKLVVLCNRRTLTSLSMLKYSSEPASTTAN